MSWQVVVGRFHFEILFSTQSSNFRIGKISQIELVIQTLHHFSALIEFTWFGTKYSRIGEVKFVEDSL